MIETEISITVNRKSDITLLEQTIVGNKFQFPVYIREYEFSYQINFTSDYEEWELDTAILNSFPGYEFTTDLEKDGRKYGFKYPDTNQNYRLMAGEDGLKILWMKRNIL